MKTTETKIGKIIKQRRASIPLTLKKLSDAAGMSPSHLARIERGERFPSARILRKIARPLGFEETELFALAGYLSNSAVADNTETCCRGAGLDPVAAGMLAQEPAEIQRMAVSLLEIVKSLAKSIREK